KLEHLSLRNNPELSPQSLKFLTSLTELKELNMSDCPLEGSLKVFVNLSKLEGLAISNTNINEGLEYLPESCKRKNKQNSIALNVPLERLYVVRGSRAATVAGGVLTLAGQPVIGGIMSSAFPFVDVVTIAVGEKGEVNEAIRGLDNVTQAFLVEYDKDENKMIDANELKEKKEELARDLDKGEESQLKKIVEAIHDLKREVIGYYKRNEKETGEIENQLEAQLTKAEEKNNGKNDKIIISQTSSQKIKQDLQD
ncbi:16938_t:CDS:2, partial [Racocetra persica]